MSVYAVPYQSLMYLIILNRMCYHKGYCYASVCAFHFVPVDNGCCQHNLLFYNIERTFADVGRSEFLTVQLKSLRQRFYSKLSAFSNKKLFFQHRINIYVSIKRLKKKFEQTFELILSIIILLYVSCVRKADISRTLESFETTFLLVLFIAVHVNRNQFQWTVMCALFDGRQSIQKYEKTK